MSTPALEISGLQAWYGESHILHGVDMRVGQGEVVTLLGRNGAGRSSTLKSVLGLVGRRSGSIKVEGQETIGLPPHKIARRGIGYCPEERGIYASLTAEENLMLLPTVGPDGMSVEEIYTMFPNLKERAHSPGTRLSGGEQQMLAMARAVMLNPELVLLDEPSMGLAPILVEEVFRIIARLKDEGVTMLLVEQFAAAALNVADYGYVLENGRISVHGSAEKLKHDPAVVAAYLGGSH